MVIEENKDFAETFIRPAMNRLAADLMGMEPLKAAEEALIFQTAVKNNKYSEFLTHYIIEELETFDIHMFYNNTMGYAITPSWEIANVFNNSLNIRHTGQAMVVDAVRHGGKTIFCYDGYPARIWKEIGFIETKREAFNRDLAPENWEYSYYGYPDLLYLTFWPALSEFKGKTTCDKYKLFHKNYRTRGVEKPAPVKLSERIKRTALCI